MRELELRVWGNSKGFGLGIFAQAGPTRWNGARRFPFGDELVLLEQILRLNLDGTPLDRIRVVPPVSGMCVSQSGSVYIAAHGKGNSERSTRLPCQLQCGVLSL